MPDYRFNNLLVHTESTYDATRLLEVFNEVMNLDRGNYTVVRNLDTIRWITVHNQNNVYSGIYIVEKGIISEEVTFNENEMRLFVNVFTSLLKEIARNKDLKVPEPHIISAWMDYFNLDVNGQRAAAARKFFDGKEDKSIEYSNYANQALIEEFGSNDKYVRCYIYLCTEKKIRPLDRDKHLFGET